MRKPRYFSPAITIPDHWTPDDALAVVSFLQRIVEAVWAAHGRAMNYRLHQVYAAEYPNVIPFSYGVPDRGEGEGEGEGDDSGMPF